MANVWDPVETFGTEAVLWYGGVVFKGGGVAPSELIGSGALCKDSVIVPCSCPSCCDGPLRWGLVVVSATIFAAVAMVVGAT